MNTNHRNPITWVPSVYFAMGLPFVMLNMVTSLMYKGLDISDEQITFWASLITLPWTLKFLWSPFLELFKSKKFFIIATQLTTGIFFALMGFALQLPSFFALTIGLSALVAFSGATHDIATDGLYMDTLDKQTQAKYIGWQGAFYNIAKIVASGGLVWLAGWLIKHFSTSMPKHDATVQAWMVVLIIIGALIVALALYHKFALPQDARKAEGRTSSEVMAELKAVLLDFTRKKHFLYYIAFIILYRLAEGFVMKIVPLFLKATRTEGGLGLSEEQIGIIYGSFGAAAFVLGSILAGYYISHFGLKRTLFSLCCVFNLPFVAYAFLAGYQPESISLIGVAIVIEYFGYGFGFVGLTLFMMHQIAPGKHQMSHYAIASGIMNLSVMVTGMASGAICTKLGYANFFLFTLVATIPAFLITYFVPFTHEEKAQNTSA